MIVRNEERQLADCLTPVATLFDEIVVVDTGSIDRTRHVAQRFTPHVFDFPWCDNFSAARNESLLRSQSEWVMWLDADDRLTPQNVSRLRGLLQQLGDDPQVYLMETVCPSQYACEGASLITHPRLFRRHPELWWQGRVHEQLRLASSGALRLSTAWSDVQILHVGYEDPTVQQRKRQRDVRLLRMDYAVDPDNASTLLHLGLAYFHLGRHDQARDCLQRLVALTKLPADYLRQAYGALANIAIRDGKFSAALAILDRALVVFPTAEYLLYLRAECLYELDRFDEAKDTLLRLIGGAAEPQYRAGVPADIRIKLAPRKLADVLLMQGQFAASETLLQSLLTQFPDDTLTWHTLGRVYLQLQQRVKLLGALEQLRRCPQGEVFADALLAAWHLAQRELDEAGPLIERLIGQAPQMPLPRLLRAEWLNQSAAPISDRIQACRDVLRVLPGNLDVRRLLHHLEASHIATNDRQPAARPNQTAAANPRDLSAYFVLDVGLSGHA
jgi:glycosyltransferase involved in cell wall biosynthesis